MSLLHCYCILIHFTAVVIHLIQLTKLLYFLLCGVRHLPDSCAQPASLRFDPGNRLPWDVGVVLKTSYRNFYKHSHRQVNARSAHCKFLPRALRLATLLAGKRSEEEVCGNRVKDLRFDVSSVLSRFPHPDIPWWWRMITRRPGTLFSSSSSQTVPFPCGSQHPLLILCSFFTAAYTSTNTLLYKTAFWTEEYMASNFSELNGRPD